MRRDVARDLLLERRAQHPAGARFAADYGAKHPKAFETLRKDEEALLTYFDFPAEHWCHLRTTNVIESSFATVRLRQRVTKGAGSRTKGAGSRTKGVAATTEAPGAGSAHRARP